MTRQPHSPSRFRRAAFAAGGVLAIGGLVALAGAVGGLSSQPAPKKPNFEDTHLDKTPPRKMTGLVLKKDGWDYNCMECHALMPAKWHYDHPIYQHADIKLEHGNNRFCLNCHHPTNRNVFVDYDGSEIPQNKVDQLCGKCHGTIHREWEAGVHGRQNGHWNKELGPATKLVCIQCHDPHSPAFKPMKPLAPLRYPPRAHNSINSDHSGPHAETGAHE
jgi:hypothetical protein